MAIARWRDFTLHSAFFLDVFKKCRVKMHAKIYEYLFKSKPRQPYFTARVFS